MRENAESLQRLTQALDVSERRVRRHVASILHDDLQQLLVACGLKVQLLQKNTGNTSNAVSEVVSLVNKALHTSRSLVSYLNHSSLASGKLGPSVDFLQKWCRENYGLDVNLDVSCREVLPIDTATLAFECLRELLFNVYKHAGASKVSVTIGEHGRALHLVVLDDGRGFDSECVTPGNAFGLVTLKARVREAGGRFILSTAPGSGVRVEISLPLAES